MLDASVLRHVKANAILLFALMIVSRLACCSVLFLLEEPVILGMI